MTIHPTVRKVKTSKPKRNTTIIKQNIGIDVSKKDFAVCFSQLRKDGTVRIVGTRKFKNTLNGIVQFMDWVEKKANN